MSEEKLDMDAVKKSLEALRETVTKGHSSKGTNTTEVETMSGQSGATQVYHTPANSNPGSWAGSVERDVPENGATDGVSDNGTDYVGAAKMLKSIMDKISKGQKLSAIEHLILKGSMAEKLDMDKAFPPKKDEDGDKDDDDKKDKNPFAKAKDDEDDMDKSFTANPKLAPGFEVSDFLRDLVSDVSKSLRTMEKNLHNHIDARISASEAKTVEITKSLAGAVSSIGDATVYTATTVAAMQNGPARAPKAVLSKGGFDGSSVDETPMTKAQVAEELYQGMVKGLVLPHDVVKFDSTGQVSPELLKRLKASR